jgi:hypothetical protein
LPELLTVVLGWKKGMFLIPEIPDRVDVFPEKDKAWLRDVMKDVERDVRGRWI